MNGRPDNPYASTVWKLTEEEAMELNVVQHKEPKKCPECRTLNTLFGPRKNPVRCYTCQVRRLKPR